MSKPYDDFYLGCALFEFGRSVLDVVGWCEFPDPEHVARDAWPDAVRSRVREAAATVGQSPGVEADTRRQVEAVASEACELVTLIHHTPALAAVSYHGWTSPGRRDQCERVAAAGREMKGLGGRMTAHDVVEVPPNGPPPDEGGRPGAAPVKPKKRLGVLQANASRHDRLARVPDSGRPEPAHAHF